MRRGYIFEQNLSKVAKYLDSIGIHMHKNHANRLQNGTFVEGEPYDYDVITHGHFHCFDAKECQSARWNLSNAKPQQVNNLLKCQRNGAEAYFLVYFVPENHIVRFNADFVKQALADGKKSLTSKEGQPWEWESLTL